MVTFFFVKSDLCCHRSIGWYFSNIYDATFYKDKTCFHSHMYWYIDFFITSSQPTNLKCVISPNTDGEVQTNYHVSSFQVPLMILCISALHGCQKELKNFSSSWHSVQTECWSLQILPMHQVQISVERGNCRNDWNANEKVWIVAGIPYFWQYGQHEHPF